MSFRWYLQQGIWTKTATRALSKNYGAFVSQRVYSLGLVILKLDVQAILNTDFHLDAVVDLRLLHGQ